MLRSFAFQLPAVFACAATVAGLVWLAPALSYAQPVAHVQSSAHDLVPRRHDPRALDAGAVVLGVSSLAAVGAGIGLATLTRYETSGLLGTMPLAGPWLALANLPAARDGGWSMEAAYIADGVLQLAGAAILCVVLASYESTVGSGHSHAAWRWLRAEGLSF